MKSTAFLVCTLGVLCGCGNIPSPLAITNPSSSAVTPEYFGMHLQCVVASCSEGRYPYPKDLGFTTVRLWDTVSWETLEPDPGRYDWSVLDSLVRLATANAVDSFIFTLGSVPLWSSSNPGGPCGRLPAGGCYPPNLGALDQFLTAFVRRECGIIGYYEVWNEPDKPEFWKGTNSQLLTIAQHMRMIAKDPANCGCTDGVCSPGGGPNPNQLLTPAVGSISTMSGREWLRHWLASSAPTLHGDIVAFHGYGSNPETISYDITWLRSLAGSYGFSDAVFWDTEASWGTEQGGSEQDEASWLMRSYVMQAVNGISRMYWYAYGSCLWGALYGPTCGEYADHQKGMRDAGIAYQTISKWMVGATLRTCTRDANQTWMCSLTRPHGYKASIVWNVTAPTAVNVLGTAFVQYRDWQNRRAALPASITAGRMPVLLENGEPDGF